MRKLALGLVASVALVGASVAIAGLKSGLDVGERVPAFYVVDVTGPSAGEKLCYRCRYGNSPVVTVFTRSTNDKVQTLVKQLDEQLAKNEELKSFVVVLTEDTKKTESELKELAKTHGLKKIPLTYMDGLAGPENYKLSKEADITVMMWVNSEVKVNHAFTAKEFCEECAKTVVADVAKILK